MHESLKTCSRCKAEKPLSEFWKDGRANYCKPCEKEYKRAYYLANRDKVIERTKQWRADNPEAYAAANKAYYAANAEQSKAHAARWAKDNPERRKAIYTASRARTLDVARKREADYRARRRAECNARIREWKKKNPHKLTHYFHKRRAAEVMALPAWANLDAIEAIYQEAQRLQASTGIPHHVDHEVPLLSPVVCGLHCEANLRAVPAADNLKKSNRYWTDMP